MTTPSKTARDLGGSVLLLATLSGCGNGSHPADAGSTPASNALLEAPCTASPGAPFVPQPNVTYLVLRASADEALQAASASSLSFAPRDGSLSQLFTFATENGALQMRSYLSGVATSWQITVSGSSALFVDPVTHECLTDPSGAQQLRLLPFKKGMGVYGDDWKAQVATLHPFWIYDWGTDTAGVPLPAGVEFVPMVWGYYGDAAGLTTTLATVRDAGARAVLAYNEPDNPSQANLAADAAAATWPTFEASGLALGSPAAVDDSDAWMQSFVQDVGGESHVGFLAVHWYGGANAATLVSYLTALHTQYGLPIWITEFCPADWNATSTAAEAFSADDAETFARQVLPALDALPWVQRFAWFNAASTDPNLGHSALFEADGGLSGPGEVYEAYPLAAP